MSGNALESFKGYENIRHSTTKIHIKCGKCLRECTNPVRVKTHKNLSSLDSHISIEHKDEFWTKEEIKLLIRQFSEAIKP